MTEPTITWSPSERDLSESNPARFMAKHNLARWEDLHRWSIDDRSGFWGAAIETLGLKFQSFSSVILENEESVEDVRWLPNHEYNVADVCLEHDPSAVAVYSATEGTEGFISTTYGELNLLVNRVANGFEPLGIQSGDRVVLYMPLGLEAVATFLGCIRAGVVPVLVADSFTPIELNKRIEITDAKAIFAYASYPYGGKTLDIYAKVKEADSPPAVLVGNPTSDLREGDLAFEDFLGDDSFESVILGAYATTGILFSSGTTKDPKAIPWTQLTPLKCAVDGYFHHDIQSDDVVTWTTSMGWMMGPWVIYASLLNRAALAVYTGAPATRQYIEFVRDVPITMLGTIPSLVKVWRKHNDPALQEWKVRVFSSTGEPSNADDYTWLMNLCSAPVIEYCGGTEIGGGYISGTVVQSASAATFTTPCIGIDFLLLNEEGQIATGDDIGHVYLITPSLGISQALLNRDHHEEYFAGCPAGPNGEILRRHGDAMETAEIGGRHFFRSGGRVDDAMNLGGIKVSSVEIETVLNEHPAIFETAAISVRPDDGGPESLVIYYVAAPDAGSHDLKKECQGLLSEQANPLYRIADMVPRDSLPRTASNKIMRRSLRKEYLETR
jgi:acetyl-CoA synthetase